MKRDRIANIIFLATIFFLPWQTRWIYASLTIGGEAWEYGKLSLYAAELLLLVVFCLRAQNDRSYKSHVTDRTYKPFVLCAAALLISFLFATNFWLSVAALPHFLFAFLLFALIADERTRVKSVAVAFVAGLAIPSLLGWFQLLSGWSPAFSWLGLAERSNMTLGDAVVGLGIRWLRAYGSYPHPNVFGGALVVGLLTWGWAWISFVSTQKRFFCVAWLAVGFLLSATLVITFSRSAILGFLLAAALGVCWIIRQSSCRPETDFCHPEAGGRRISQTFFLPSIVVTLSFIIVASLFHSQLFSRIVPDSRMEQLSISEREQGYRLAGRVIQTSPITGVGIGGYTAALADIVPGKPWWFYQPVHNIFLLALAEVGMIGFVLFGIVDFYACRALWRSRRLSVGIFGAMMAVSLLIPALFDHYLWSMWPGLSLTAFAAGFSAKLIGKKTS